MDLDDPNKALTIAREIYKLQASLPKQVDAIRETGKAKAAAERKHDERAAIAVARMELGEGIQIADMFVSKPRASATADLRKGSCLDEQEALTIAEAMYKAATCEVSITEARISALQSVLKVFGVV